ncbi:twin-arginine translocase TatA/TatE family subunit [Frondihabitans sp. PhB188]|uniref:twin-arginine translocase TatA/TatE family subunit n=1 Tax=Frondihabitans sp. PhB188 TaxID=2485200 RepID=UPI003519E2AB
MILLLLFGAPKLPGLAKSIAQSMKIFRTEIAPNHDNKPTDTSSAAPSAGTVNDTTVHPTTTTSTDLPPKQ